MLVRLSLLLREAVDKKWKKVNSMLSKLLDQLESKIKSWITYFNRGYVIDDIDTSHYMKDFNA